MSTPRAHVDFDIHGVVGVRLLDAAERNVEAVRRQLGPLERPLDRDPDVVVRFVDRLPSSGTLRSVGLESGHSAEDFFVLQGKHKAAIRVRIPFEKLADPVDPGEIVCERSLPAVPLLVPIVNLTALCRGSLPLHSSGFQWQGIGVVCTGWSKGGKTETLLAFMERNALYVGDEWMFLRDGTMCGIPESMHVWDWHFDSLIELRRRIGRRRQAMLKLGRSFVNRAVRMRPAARGRSLLRRASHVVEKQLHVRCPPHALFGPDRCTGRVPFDKVILTGVHDQPEVITHPVPAQEVIDRMQFSLEDEMERLLAWYRKFRFAFPARANPRLDDYRESIRAALQRELEGRECYELLHPYPVELPLLYEAVAPLLRE